MLAQVLICSLLWVLAVSSVEQARLTLCQSSADGLPSVIGRSTVAPSCGIAHLIMKQMEDPLYLALALIRLLLLLCTRCQLQPNVLCSLPQSLQ